MTDAPNFRHVTKSPAPIVDMIEFQDRMFVATTEGVYELNDGKLYPLEFVTIEPEPVIFPADLGGHDPSCEAAQMVLNPQPNKLYHCTCAWRLKP